MVGQLIAGRYELEELVGSGGMASVYRAHDRLLERRVAVKILHEHFSSEEEAVERFQREARSVAQLAHPNIVTVIDRGEQDGRPYIVFEYVEGENLKELLNRQGPLPVPAALDFAIRVALALEAAHERGVVHRDVKPHNVLLAEEGRAKVTDFGIARASGTQGLTITGTIMGTSDYISPEQAKGEPSGEAGDVYSLGVVLFELLTGRVPYEAENPVAVAMRHVHDPVPSVREFRPDVPPRVDALVQRALAKAPHDRFATMSAFVAELEAARADGRAAAADDGAPTMIVPPAGRAAQAPRRRGTRALRTLLLSFLAVLLVAGAALGAYALTRAISSDDDGGNGGANGAGAGAAVALRGLSAFDPDGDLREHDADAPYATDRNPATYWRTETYRAGLAKDGVGLLLAAPAAQELSRITVVTDTPGITAEIRAGGSRTGPFEAVSDPRTVGASTVFTLPNTDDRFYVVWITDLGDDNNVAHVNEVRARS